MASDGCIFSFGGSFSGSLGNLTLNAPVTGMASTDDGAGYWMVGADGGAFAFGDAPFWGPPADLGNVLPPSSAVSRACRPESEERVLGPAAIPLKTDLTLL